MPDATLTPGVATQKKVALPIARLFSAPGRHPFDEVEWEKRPVVIRGMNGVTHEEEGEFPVFWSVNASNITGSKYFRGKIGTPTRENSVKQMISRVVRVAREWGLQFGHFDTETEANTFADELTHILLFQKASFNSPVWFNVGVETKPQCSACFILSVEDDMRSIMDWIYTEAMIFKGGSGAGVNLSPLRSSHEKLTQGGRASGPVSFMRGADSIAGMIASGGSTRRAAKMVVLNADHPDIMSYVRSKADEEKKVRALMAAGYDMQDLNNDGWKSIQYQNANNSVRVTDEFMRAAETDSTWQTRYIMTGEVAGEMKARELLRAIAEASWECGDPGLQYDTTINRWNTAANTGRINATNPCAEYIHLDNSACNLASINLIKFLGDDDSFRVEDFMHTVRIMILAQEILVGGSSYPTPKIEKNAHDFRELGLGYANLGAFMMALGVPYDSAEGQAIAGGITALMTGEAYRYSAVIAARMGPFAGFAVNREPMTRVLRMHRDALSTIARDKLFDPRIYDQAVQSWNEAVRLGETYGVRNSQVTVIAPTGTISFMMDCDTTGVEPDFSLVKTKNLVGGGVMKIVNRTVPRALRRLGYDEVQINDIIAHIEAKGTVEGAPHIQNEHLAVFDCAVKPANGTRSIAWQGHVRVVAAVQPFISGGISKTFNMPYETTVEEIMEAYIMAWKLGIKCFAVYRDGSKAAQPLVTSSGKGGAREDAKQVEMPFAPMRRRMPATRASETHKFVVAGHEGYMTYSVHPDDGLAEIFIRMAKQGSTLAGLLDSFAIMVSVSLQYGVPLKDLVRRFAYTRFEPAGFTENADIQVATSIVDYIFRYLGQRFLSPDELAELGINASSAVLAPLTNRAAAAPMEGELEPTQPVRIEATKAIKIEETVTIYADSVCRNCGGMLVQTGACKTCRSCGVSTGGC
ncbi:vitamin B12-dependent ribonucleotide reductase [Candidatus Parcubacteria bacterium]|nr:MAG: vitamin B12-dependent ribonucleotide reductase [Candidatus Parcubacteria bacterium]